MLKALAVFACLLSLPALVGAQVDAGSNGQDLAFDAAALDGSPLDADGVANQAVVIDLARADTGQGTGTYDGLHWRVTFHYTSVVVQQGYSVAFLNHPSRAPVVWLSQADIVIGGTVDVRGQGGATGGTVRYAEPGPGGFRGGLPKWDTLAWLGSSGFGPGGGYQNQSGTGNGGGGGHAGGGAGPGGPAYGDETVAQLLGGSGGAADRHTTEEGEAGGGAGGGAILMAANAAVRMRDTGAILANGGAPACWWGCSGGGAGGAVRLVADTIVLEVGANVQAMGATSLGGGHGSVGRVRLEGNDLSGIAAVTQPAFTSGSPGPIAPPSDQPTVVVLTVDGQPLPSAPEGSLLLPDLPLTAGANQEVVIETTYVPLGSAVYLRITGARGPASEVLVTDGADGNELQEVVPGAPDLRARTSVSMNFAEGISAVQARVVLPNP